MNKPKDTNTIADKTNAQHSIKAGPRGHASPSARRTPKIPKKITETYLHNSGLYYLQRYAASTAQFRTVMLRKISKSCHHHKDQDEIACVALLDQLIERFVSSGLLNDTGYARGMVSSLRRRGASQRMIIMKLQAKGLSESQIKSALADFNEDHDVDPMTLELQGALKLARRKKFGPYANGVEYDRNKAIATFARAGFSFDIIRQVLGMDANEELDFLV